jgi:hypothetical protein
LRRGVRKFFSEAEPFRLLARLSAALAGGFLKLARLSVVTGNVAELLRNVAELRRNSGEYPGNVSRSPRNSPGA